MALSFFGLKGAKLSYLSWMRTRRRGGGYQVKPLMSQHRLFLPPHETYHPKYHDYCFDYATLLQLIVCLPRPASLQDGCVCVCVYYHPGATLPSPISHRQCDTNALPLHLTKTSIILLPTPLFRLQFDAAFIIDADTLLKTST